MKGTNIVINSQTTLKEYDHMISSLGAVHIGGKSYKKTYTGAKNDLARTLIMLGYISIGESLLASPTDSLAIPVKFEDSYECYETDYKYIYVSVEFEKPTVEDTKAAEIDKLPDGNTMYTAWLQYDDENEPYEEIPYIESYKYVDDCFTCKLVCDSLIKQVTRYNVIGVKIDKRSKWISFDESVAKEYQSIAYDFARWLICEEKQRGDSLIISEVVEDVLATAMILPTDGYMFCKTELFYNGNVYIYELSYRDYELMYRDVDNTMALVPIVCEKRKVE